MFKINGSWLLSLRIFETSFSIHFKFPISPFYDVPGQITRTLRSYSTYRLQRITTSRSATQNANAKSVTLLATDSGCGEPLTTSSYLYSEAYEDDVSWPCWDKIPAAETEVARKSSDMCYDDRNQRERSKWYYNSQEKLI
jgi:hypothetical protein